MDKLLNEIIVFFNKIEAAEMIKYLNRHWQNEAKAPLSKCLANCLHTFRSLILRNENGTSPMS